MMLSCPVSVSSEDGGRADLRSLPLISYLKHSGLRDNQQDVRASISLLQCHQLIHGPWLSELERGALPTHPALAVHIPELVELGSWFGQVAGCGKKSQEPQYDLWLFLLGEEKCELLSTRLQRSLGCMAYSFCPATLTHTHSTLITLTLLATY